MLRGVLIGFVAGFVLAAGALRLVARAPEAGQAAPVDAPVAASPAPAAPVEDLSALRNAVEARRADLAALRSATAALHEPKPAAKLTWKDVVPCLVQAVQARKQRKPINVAEVNAAILQLEACFRELALERGLTLEEAMASPEGRVALSLSFMEASDPPPDPAQLARCRKLIDDYRSTFDRFLADRGHLTKFEQRVRLAEISGAMDASLEGEMTDAQYFDLQRSVVRDVRFAAQGRHHSGGTRDEIAADLTQAWATALGIGEMQAGSLRPIVESYVAAWAAIPRGVGKPDDSPGARANPQRSLSLARLRAQLEAERKIAETLPLTPEQQAALRNWGVIYDLTIEPDGAPPEKR